MNLSLENEVDALLIKSMTNENTRHFVCLLKRRACLYKGRKKKYCVREHQSGSFEHLE